MIFGPRVLSSVGKPSVLSAQRQRIKTILNSSVGVITVPKPNFTNLFPTFNDLSISDLADYFGGGSHWTLAPGTITVGTTDTSDSVRYLAVTLQANTQYTMEGTFVRRPGSGTGTVRADAYQQVSGISPPVITDTVTDGVPYHSYSTFTTDSTGQCHPGVVYQGSNAALKGGGIFDYYNLALSLGGPKFTASDPAYTPPVDLTQQFLNFPNWPSQRVEANTAAVFDPDLAPSLQLNANAVNLSSADFTPTGNVNTREKLDARYFMAGIFGNLNTVTGLPIDGLSNNFGRYRRYPKGHVYDLHTFSNRGLTLGVVGKNNDDPNYKYGEVYCGMIRDQENFTPGMCREVIYEGATNDDAWGPIWGEIGFQQSPGPGGDPYNNRVLKVPPIYTPGGGNPYYEHDDNDAYTQSYNGAPTGSALTAGMIRRGLFDDPPNIKVFPYTKFVAKGGTFGNPLGTKPVLASKRFNQGMHSLVLNWLPDGTVQYIFDGELFLEQWQDYKVDTFTNPLTNAVEVIGMHLICAGQFGPEFNPNARNPDRSFKPIVINDRTTCSITVRSIKIWKGNVKQSSISRGTNAVTSAFAALTTSSTTPKTGAAFATTLSGKQYSGSYLAVTDANGLPNGEKASNGSSWTIDSNGKLAGTPATDGTFTVWVTEFPGTHIVKINGVDTELPGTDADSGVGIPRTTAFVFTASASGNTGGSGAFVPTGANLITQSPGDFRPNPPWGQYSQGGGINRVSATQLSIDGSGNNTQIGQQVFIPAGTYKTTITATRTSGTGNLGITFYGDGGAINGQATLDQGAAWVTGTKRTITTSYVLNKDLTSSGFSVNIGIFDGNSGDYTFDLQSDGSVIKFERTA